MDQEVAALIIFGIAIMYAIYQVFKALIPKDNCKDGNCNCKTKKG